MGIKMLNLIIGVIITAFALFLLVAPREKVLKVFPGAVSPRGVKIGAAIALIAGLLMIILVIAEWTGIF